MSEYRIENGFQVYKDILWTIDSDFFICFFSIVEHRMNSQAIFSCSNKQVLYLRKWSVFQGMRGPQETEAAGLGR